MSSELRVRCFFEEGMEGAGSRDSYALGQSERSWVTRGDGAALRSSLDELLDRLATDAGEYLVKVVVHRKLEARPSSGAVVRPDPMHQVSLQRASHARALQALAPVPLLA